MNGVFIPETNIGELDYEKVSNFSNIKYDLLFNSERKLGDIRNLYFKVNSLAEKYMIFLEINRNNTDSIDLNRQKIKFFDILGLKSEIYYNDGKNL